MDENGTVISKQQLGNETPNSFRAREETSGVEQTAVGSETDVSAFWQVPFCLTVHDAEKMENKVETWSTSA